MDEAGVRVPMIADAAGHLRTAYGLYDDVADVNTRDPFIIDPERSPPAPSVCSCRRRPMPCCVFRSKPNSDSAPS